MILDKGLSCALEIFKMSTSTLISSDLNLESVLDEALAQAQAQLTELALRADFLDQMKLAFGNEFDVEKLEALRQQWAAGNFEIFPEIEARSGAELKGANGAFAAATNTIYVSRDYLERNGANLPAVTNVLLEEFGHFVDARINGVDAVGDEGALFETAVRGETLSAGQLEQLRSENDSGTITVDAEVVGIEQQTNSINVRRGDVTEINLVEILSLTGQNYTFTIEQDNIIGGSIALGLDPDGPLPLPRPILSSQGEFGQTGIFYFIPEITAPSTSETSPAQGPNQSTINWQEQSTGQSGILTINIVDYQPGPLSEYGYSSDNPTTQNKEEENSINIDDTSTPQDEGVLQATNILEIYRVQQRLRYLGYRKPLDLNSNILSLPTTGSYIKNTLQRRNEWKRAIRGAELVEVDGILGNKTRHSIGVFNAAVGQSGRVEGDLIDDSPNNSIPVHPFINARNAPRWVLLPDTGQGWINQDEINVNSPDHHDWGTHWSIEAIQRAGNNNNSGFNILVNDLSFTGGGFTTDHTSHQSGNDIDIRLGLGSPWYDLTTVADNLNQNSQLNFWERVANEIQNDAIQDDPSTPDFNEGPIIARQQVAVGGNFDDEYTFANGRRVDQTIDNLYSRAGSDDAYDRVIRQLSQNNSFEEGFNRLIPTVQGYSRTRAETQIRSFLDLETDDTSSGQTIGAFYFNDPIVRNNIADNRLASSPTHANHFHIDVNVEDPQYIVPSEIPLQDSIGNAIFNGFSGLDSLQEGINSIYENIPFQPDATSVNESSNPNPQTRTLFKQSESSKSLISEVSEDPTSFIIYIQENILSGLHKAINSPENLTPEILQKILLETLGPPVEYGDTLLNPDNETVNPEEILVPTYLGEGLGILQDINGDGLVNSQDLPIIVAPDGSDIKFNLRFSRTALDITSGLDKNFGLPGLGFEVDADANLKFGYTFDLGFGVSKDYGFYIDTSSDEEITIDLSTELSIDEAIAKLGFLQFEVKDNQTDKPELTAKFSVDLKDPGGTVDGDGDRLTFNELTNLGNLGGFKSLIGFDLSGSASADLNLRSFINPEFTGEEASFLPSIGTNLKLDWKFRSDDPTTTTINESNFGAPNVSFNNVTLYLGEFISEFANPILGKVQKVTQPIGDGIDFMTKPLEPLNKLKANVDYDKTDNYKNSLYDIAGFAAQISDDVKGTDIEPKFQTLGKILNAVDAITDAVNAIPMGVDNIPIVLIDKIDFGKPDLSSQGTTLKDAKPSDLPDEISYDEIINKINSSTSGSNQSKTDTSNFIAKVGAIKGEGDSGFKFPILTDPSQALDLLLGNGSNVYMFQYNAPIVGFEVGYTQEFRIWGPLKVAFGGKVGAEIDVGFGYDAGGLKQFVDSGFSNPSLLAEGFYLRDSKDFNDPIGTDNPELSIYAGIEAAALLDVLIAAAGAGGDITATFNLDLNDPSFPPDGKVRFSEFKALVDESPLCLFDASGDLTAGLFAFFRAGVGPFKYTKRFDSPRVTIASFEFGCDSSAPGTPEPPPVVLAGLADDSPNTLFLFMGNRANQRSINQSEETEAFSVTQSGASFSISAFGGTQTKDFGTVNKIVADGGSSNDIIDVSAVTVATNLTGGAGSDGLRSGSGNDELEGNEGFDNLDGGSGTDTLRGGNDDDYLIGGPGSDLLDGGEGFDVASYETATASISINLETNVFTGDASGDTLVSIEQIDGSNHNDTIIGNADANIFNGLEGNDTLRGNGGDDLLIGEAGADILDGGNGRDAASYANSSVGVSINLATGITSGGEAQGDVLISIEDLEGSSIGDDSLVGNDSDNFLNGSGGNDTLEGGGGNDILVGGTGANVLKGGLGQDTGSYLSYTKLQALEEGTSPSMTGVFASLVEGKGQAGADTADIQIVDENGQASTLSDDISDTLDSLENLEGSVYDDELVGDSFSNTLQGGRGADTLKGGDGNDTASYKNSERAVVASLSNNTGSIGELQIIYEVSNGSSTVQRQARLYVDQKASLLPDEAKTISETALQDTFEAIENLEGSAFDDTLEGSSGNNTINGLLGADSLDGKSGNDHLIGDEGNDTIDGGAGMDTVHYDNSFKGVTVNIDEVKGYSHTASAIALEPDFTIDKGQAQDGFDTTDTLKNLENIIGSDHGDILIGNSQANVIRGNSGNDLVIGNAGNDDLDGGEGIDTVSYRRDPAGVTVNLSTRQATDGFGGIDQVKNFENIVGSNYADTITGNDETNIITAGGGADIVKGGAGDDKLYGDAGNDFLYGDSGDDILIGGAGNGWPSDILDGGDGTDTASYITAQSRVAASLLQKNGWEGDARGDQFISIENLEGSTFNDFLVGDNSDNTLTGQGGDDDLDGGLGNDALYGNGGKDTLYGNEGDDTLDGGEGDDTIRGGQGNDSLQGGEGDDRLEGNEGNDILDGGAGNNHLDAGEGSNTITADHGQNTVYGGSGRDIVTLGDGNNDIRVGEGINTITVGDGNNLIYTGAGADTITTGNGNNTIYAAEGNNKITTGDGNDTIYSGSGADLIAAGRGSNELWLGSGQDTISLVLGGSTTIHNFNFRETKISLGSLNIGDLILKKYGNDALVVIQEAVLATLKDVNFNDVADNAVSIFGVQLSISPPTIPDLGGPITGTLDNETIDLQGKNRNYQIYGNGGKDTLIGGNGDDEIYGGSDADTILGGAGNDTIYGNGGGDFIDGGAGADTIWLGGSATVVLSQESDFDTIQNFQLGSTQFKVSSLDGLQFADSAGGTQIFQGSDLLAVVSWNTADIFSMNLNQIFIT